MRALLLSFLLAFGALPAAAQSRLWVQGADFNGGAPQLFETPTYTFSITTFSDNNSVLWLENASHQTEILNFAPPPGRFLAPGAYEHATRAAFRGTSPGMDFRGCETDGRFVILEIAFATDGAITQLAMDFEIHCANPLYGELRFNSSIPLTIEKPAGSTQSDAFGFRERLYFEPSTQAVSDAVSIYGINAPAAISVTGGEYSVNGADFTAAPGSVVNRDRVRVRTTSPAAPGGTATATLSAGGQQANFSVTTMQPGAPQTGFRFSSPYYETLFAHAPEWAITMTQSPNGLQVDGVGPGSEYFSLQLRGPQDAPLAPGAYEEARYGPFPGAAPGLYVIQIAVGGCSNIRGRFVVHEIDIAANVLAADFLLYCDNQTLPNRGEIRINATRPFTFQVTGADPTPDPMAFYPADPARAGATVVSSETRLTGVNTLVPISIAGGEYSINGGPFTSSPGGAWELDAIRVRTKASLVPGAARQVTLTAGGVSAVFTVKTYAPGQVLNGLVMNSTGDPVGRGQNHFYVAPVASVVPTLEPTRMYLYVQGLDQHYFYTFISAPGGSGMIAPGTYENTQRFSTATQAGLDVVGDHVGCDPVAGRLVVHEAVYAGGTVQRFAADFTQSCPGWPGLLIGQVRFNSTLAFSPLLGVNSATDTSGDGLDDLVLRNDDGRQAIWLMNGLTPVTSAEILGAGTGWSVTHVADFDVDGKSDLVWQHTDGRMALYLMNGTSATTTQQLLNAGSGWTVTHTADFNGDAKADLLFRHADGSVALWLMDGLAMTGGTTLTGPGSGWSVTRTGDFDGDGKADVLWAHPDGRAAIWLMNGAAVKSTGQILNAGSGWSATHVADFNGDGRADIAWQHTDGRIAAWLMNGTAMASGATLMNAASGWSVARTGDFDGDGKADLFFEHTDGRAAIWLMDGLMPITQSQILNPASGWRVHKLVDLDGDGRADIIWRHADGRHAAWLMFGTAMTSGGGIIGPGTGWTVSPLP